MPTATLIIRLPQSVEVPAGSYAVRNKTALLRVLLRAFQDDNLELIYVGPMVLTPPQLELGTTIVINVLQADDKLADNSAAREVLLKRFEKEIRYNAEHIIIDSGMPEKRLIEIYVSNRNADKL